MAWFAGIVDDAQRHAGIPEHPRPWMPTAGAQLEESRRRLVMRNAVQRAAARAEAAARYPVDRADADDTGSNDGDGGGTAGLNGEQMPDLVQRNQNVIFICL